MIIIVVDFDVTVNNPSSTYTRVFVANLLDVVQQICHCLDTHTRENVLILDLTLNTDDVVCLTGVLLSVPLSRLQTLIRLSGDSAPNKNVSRAPV